MGLRKNAGELGWLWPYRIVLCFFPPHVGLLESVQVRAVSGSLNRSGVCYPFCEAQTICENSSGRSHGARGYWKQWKLWLGIFRTLYFKLYYECKTFCMSEGKQLNPQFLQSVWLQRSKLNKFNSADAMRVSKPSLQITVMFRLSIFGGFNSRQKFFWRFLKVL